MSECVKEVVGHCYYTPLSLSMSFLNICVALAVGVGVCVCIYGCMQA